MQTRSLRTWKFIVDCERSIVGRGRGRLSRTKWIRYNCSDVSKKVVITGTGTTCSDPTRLPVVIQSVELPRHYRRSTSVGVNPLTNVVVSPLDGASAVCINSTRDVGCVTSRTGGAQIALHQTRYSLRISWNPTLGNRMLGNASEVFVAFCELFEVFHAKRFFWYESNKINKSRKFVSLVRSTLERSLRELQYRAFHCTSGV